MMENVINTHVGHMVKAVIDARGMAYAHFAKEMQLHRSSTTQLLNRPDWYISQLLRASEVLHVNFFSNFYTPGNTLQEPLAEYKNVSADLNRCREELQHVQRVSVLFNAVVLQHHNGHASLAETQKYIGEISHTKLQFLQTDLPKFGQ